MRNFIGAEMSREAGSYSFPKVKTLISAYVKDSTSADIKKFYSTMTVCVFAHGPWRDTDSSIEHIRVVGLKV